MASSGGNRPASYVLATTRVALGKFYKTNVIKLFRETFDELERYWDSLPETGDSACLLYTSRCV